MSFAFLPPPPPPLSIGPAAPASKKSSASAQKAVGDFWDKFISKTPGKVTRIFPPSLFATLVPDDAPSGPVASTSATASYEAAAEECRRKVTRIVRECGMRNEKWSDPDFDIERDFDYDAGNCLHGLATGDGDDSSDAGADVDAYDLRDALDTLTKVPGLVTPLQDMSLDALLRVLRSDRQVSMPEANAVHRVDWIYEKPAFTIDGFGTSDVQQGGTGDCWWVASVATLCSTPGQMERVCVARDEECGVYGFVFHRDGAWVPAVVDDNLYLWKADFDKSSYDPRGQEARRYKERYQTGSEALAFAKCADPNETWLPLLEKAYAKVHGDYDAISGGFPGEGVEDMTGGVTTSLDTNKVLRKEKLWKELLNPDKDFIFAASTPGALGGDSSYSNGLALQHAYSVLRAVEEEDESGKKVRLVLIRNPWGKRGADGGEWIGPWSDGSKEWTPYWLKKLDYKFDDDGIFWISFEDMLNRFTQLDRTRIFKEDWHVVQKWTSINVSWMSGYINTKFVVEVTKPGLVVFVLSKLDDRYFKGLEGEYVFELHFILQEAGSGVGDRIARIGPSSAGSLQRSVSIETELEAGKYEVVPKILATKADGADAVEDVVKKWAKENPQKLRQVGLNYDVANLKAAPPEISSKTDKRKDAKTEQPVASGTTEPNTEAPVKQEPAPEVVKEEEKAEAAKEEQKAESPKDEPLQESVKDEQTATEVKESGKPEESSGESAEPKLAPPTEPATTGTGAVPPQGTEIEDIKAEGEKPEEKAVDSPLEDEDAEESHWNAVCAIGLRVYSKDPDTVITLETASSVQEGAMLNVDGSAAGATM